MLLFSLYFDIKIILKLKLFLFPFKFHKFVCVCSQSYSTLCSPMACHTPGSSVHGIFQARIGEWVATSYSRGSSQPRDWTHVSCISCIASWLFTTVPSGFPHRFTHAFIFKKLSDNSHFWSWWFFKVFFTQYSLHHIWLKVLLYD